MTAAQKDGLAYQDKVGAVLLSRSLSLLRSPWIAFEDDTGPHLAQPDFVVLQPCPVVFEIKRTLTDAAWEQLRLLYLPLLKVLFPQSRFRPIVIAKFASSTIARPLAFVESWEDFGNPCSNFAWDGKRKLPAWRI